MIRVVKVDGTRVRLGLSGTEAEVRAAVDAFFQAYDPHAWKSHMDRALYDGKGGLTVSLSRDFFLNPKYKE